MGRFEGFHLPPIQKTLPRHTDLLLSYFFSLLKVFTRVYYVGSSPWCYKSRRNIVAFIFIMQDMISIRKSISLLLLEDSTIQLISSYKLIFHIVTFPQQHSFSLITIPLNQNSKFEM